MFEGERIMTEAPRAVVLLSGGLDSATCLAIARSEGFACYALTIDYGQRHRVELEAAVRVAQHLGVERHITLPLDLRAFGGSALTADIAVPKDRAPDATDIPVTYVPARNTMLLSLALGWAETLAARAIFIGVNAVDYSGYPDCRLEFITAFQNLARLATKAGVADDAHFIIKTPLIDLSKAEIIRTGQALGLDYGLTHSCYDPSAEGLSCGQCESCRLRMAGFAAAGLPDPTRYVQS
jgi:7-cyano-7-deazaguanine synthase